jgi:hypothetical protein
VSGDEVIDPFLFRGDGKGNRGNGIRPRH